MLDLDKIRKEFPMINNHPELLFLDNSATTLKPQCVIDEVVNYYTSATTNIHRGDYTISANVSNSYEDVRKKVARFINAHSENEIVFTSGATQSLNLVAANYVNKLEEGDVILTTLAEHASTLIPWFQVAKQTGAKIEYIPLTESGRCTVENFKKVLANRVKVVALAQITNVLGYIVPIEEITKLAHEVGAVVVCDGAQTVPHMPCDVTKWDVDYLAFSAHKCCGPTGVGVLYGKFHLLESFNPVNFGGGSNARFYMNTEVMLKKAPFKFESGTPAIEATLGLGRAIDYLDSIGMENIEKHEIALKTYCIEKLSQLEQVILYNPEADSGIIAFNIKDVFAQDAAAYLNFKNIAVRSGDHCAKVLPEVIGVGQTIRASFYFYNTFEEVDRFVEAVSEITLENCINVYL